MQNILPSPIGGVQNMLGYLFGTNRTTGLQTVIAIKHTVYVIAWLALNQTVRVYRCHISTVVIALPARHEHGGKSATTPTILARVRYR